MEKKAEELAGISFHEELIKTGKQSFTHVFLSSKWATDVKEIHIPEGKLYLSAILDIHNGEIVSYDISSSPNFKQTLNMLETAFEKPGNENLRYLLFQSDQG